MGALATPGGTRLPPRALLAACCLPAGQCTGALEDRGTSPRTFQKDPKSRTFESYFVLARLWVLINMTPPDTVFITD